VLIGERPGLSAPDSLGCYITWQPRPGLPDSRRNCISNIRRGGLAYEDAAAKVAYLITEARRRRISGVMLKEDAAPLLEQGPETPG
jgi:ethanolamine ammonia-lyase small subunit